MILKRKEKELQLGRKLAERIYDFMEQLPKKPDNILYNSKIREDIQALEPAGNTREAQKEYVIEKLSLCIMVLLIGMIFSVLMIVKDCTDKEITDNRLQRNSYGDGSKSVNLVANDGEKDIQIQLELDERHYTDKELEEMYDAVTKELDKKILDRNTSFDCIEYDMNLVTSVSEYPLEIEWSIPDGYMDNSGRLLQEKLQKPVITELTAKITYEDFEREYIINCNIYSRAEPFGIKEKIEKKLIDLEENSREEEYMTLPSEIEDKSLEWNYNTGRYGIFILLLTPLIAAVIYYGMDNDLHKKVEEREQQMRMDYPEIVSNLALLIGAGMTVQNAWNKVTSDYRNIRKETGVKRYAYEEMLYTLYEIENGISQSAALEHFGRRCHIQSYAKLATLLSQNLRKGTSNLSALLKAEAKDAFEDRKHIAREQGEKAGTKLLAPMMILLGVVMTIIIIPAMTSYL